MKRYVALLACAFALSACGNQSSSDQSANDQSANDQSANDQSSTDQTSSQQASDSQASNTQTDNDQSSADQAGNDQSDNSSSTDSASSNDNSSTDNSNGFANDNAKRSYALGMDIGNSLKDLPIDIDLGQLNQGVKDVVNGDKTKLTKKQLQGVMQGVVSDMEAAQKQKQEKQSKANLDKGQQFLANNKTKDGVKTLDDGLQYKVIKPGKGQSPDANDSVTVDYTGTLIDGTVFDSSEKRGKPVTFPVNAVIPGWTQALQLMKPGGEYKLFIPPALAYGERGAGSQIGPNETLIFDVKLISVDKNKGTGADKAGSAGDSTGSSGDDASQSSDQSAVQGADQSDDSAGDADQGTDQSNSAGQTAKQGADQSDSAGQSKAQGAGQPGSADDADQGSGNASGQ
ncbi:MAG: FKBP-type peptidyl-prolyl cis-trans isomerase [Salinisphaera sp.]|nr:FKBP-type peptidyl-prolyl cis-trans isomerase [Salinisphaera sp.]